MDKIDLKPIIKILVIVLIVIVVIILIIIFSKRPKMYTCNNGICVEDDDGKLTKAVCEKTCGLVIPPDLPAEINPGAGSGSPSSVLNSVQGLIYKDTNIGGYVTYMPKNMIDIPSTQEFTKGVNGSCTKDSDGECKNYNVKKGSKNHGSSIAQLKDGTFVVCWFSGVCEGYPQVAIQYSILYPGSGNWTARNYRDGSNEVTANSFINRSNQNSVLNYDKYNDVLRLFFPSQTCNCECDGLSPNEAYSQVYNQDFIQERIQEQFGDFIQTYVQDSWSPKTQVLKSPNNNFYSDSEGVYIKNKIVQFDKDSWWIPGYIFPNHVADDDNQLPVNWVTTNGGNSYTMQYIGGKNDTNAGGRVQPSIFKFNGSYYAFMRDRDQGYVWYSIYDNSNWSPLKKTDIPNNNSAIQGMEASDGSLLLALNPQQKHRNNLTIARCPKSKDPTVWGNYKKFQIENGPEDRDFSYPWIIEDDNNNIHITYTLRQQRSNGNDVERDDGWYIMWRMFPESLIKDKLI